MSAVGGWIGFVRGFLLAAAAAEDLLFLGVAAAAGALVAESAMSI
jgi:hypothetical protein